MGGIKDGSQVIEMLVGLNSGCRFYSRQPCNSNRLVLVWFLTQTHDNINILSELEQTGERLQR